MSGDRFSLRPVDAARHAALAGEVLPPVRLLIGEQWRLTGGSGSPARQPGDRPRAGRGAAGRSAGRRGRGRRRARRAARLAGARPDGRRDALLRLAGLLRRDGDQIGQVLWLECAVPAAPRPALPRRGADYLEYFAGLADKIEGPVIPIFPETAFDYTLPEPYGVVGLISTWNGGISSLARKAGAALAAGNTVVAKAMELAPFSSVIFGELALEAGMPPGAVNILPGDAAAGEALVRHPGWTS